MPAGRRHESWWSDSVVEAVSTQERHVRWLDRGVVSRADVGGKGASLSQLAALGAPVPPAFALTTDAYRAFAAAHGVPARATDVDDNDLTALRARMLAAPVPGEVAAMIAEGHGTLRARAAREVALAVRSSATAEDSAEFSFAGLHDTILDVRTPAALDAAIKRCWASLWSDRAVAYRRTGGLATDEAAIAVVIQQLVHSDVSFIVFTRDPVGNCPGHLVIDASWGLGEAVVSGLVVPDHIIVGPEDEIAEYTVGDKQVMVIPGASPGDGAREVAVPRVLRTAPALSEARVREIAALARSLSLRLGYDADLEGGIQDGRLYLFQARPITTLGASL